MEPTEVQIKEALRQRFSAACKEMGEIVSEMRVTQGVDRRQVESGFVDLRNGLDELMRSFEPDPY